MSFRFTVPAGDGTSSLQAQVRLRRYSLALPVLLYALVGAEVTAQRDTVRASLGDVRRLVLLNSPELRAARVDTAVAHGELRQARLIRFNPSFDVVGPAAGKGLEPQVTQEIEIFGQRGTRLRATRAGLDRSRAGVNDAARRAIGDVDRTFYRLASATQQVVLASEVLALNTRLADIARRQLAAGEISRLDYNLAVVEYGRSRARALAVSRLRESLSIDLVRMAGLPAGAVVLPTFDSTSRIALPSMVGGAVGDTSIQLDVDSLVALAVARRPDLAERGHAARVATALAASARREALPNILIRGVSERDAGESRVVRAGVGLTLPVFNLNQGEVEARRAEAEQARLQRVALLARVRAEVAALAAQLQSARVETVVLETTVLSPARQNRQLLETAYREGKVGLPVLLLIRNQVIDAELQYWEAWLAQNEALATLEEALALNTEPAEPAR